MSAELEAYRACVLAALNRMANVEERMARAAHPADRASEIDVHHHAERCLREAAKAVEGLPRE